MNVAESREGYLTTHGRRSECLCAARRSGSFSRRPRVCARLSADGSTDKIKLAIADMTPEERAIVKAGCLINYNRQKNA